MHNIRHIHVNTSKRTYWPKYMTYLAWQGTHAVLWLSGMVWASEMFQYLQWQQFAMFWQFHMKYSNSEVMITTLLHTTTASHPKEFWSHALYIYIYVCACACVCVCVYICTHAQLFSLKIKLFSHSSNTSSSMHETSYNKTFQYETTDY